MSSNMEMKTQLHLVLLVSLLTLISCGAKKSGTTLTVSNGMAISNTAFDGGLVFFGRSTDGKIFSAPVAYNTGAGNQVQIELDRGQWTFGAVGWKTGGDEFVGIAECALVTTDLNSTEQTVNLDLTAAGCDDAAWGGNIGTPGAGNFKDFSLITCGTLYSNTTSKTLLTADNPIFCSTNPAMAPDFKIYAKSARIYVPVLIPGQAPNNISPLSNCFDLDPDGTFTTAKQLPSKALPLAIELFDDISCAANDLIAKYELLQGMDFNYSGFDRLFFAPSSDSNLYLLANMSRRGQSPFMDSIPQFRCDPSVNAYPCIQLPTSTEDRFVQPGQEIYIKELVAGESCTNLSDAASDVVVGSTSLGAGAFTCREENGKMFLRLQESDFTTCSTTCTLYLKLTVSATTTNISIEKSPALPSAQAYDFIFRTLGHQDLISSAPAGTLLNAYNSLSTFTGSFNSHDEDKHFGLLSHIREMFSPDMAGIFYNGPTVNVSFWEEGEQRSYRLKAESVSSPIPAFITSNTNPGVLSTTRNFDRRITISRIIGGAFYDEQILLFIDGEKVGMSEMYHYKDDTDYSETRIERELIYWNTQGTELDRIERYNLETTKILNTATIKHFRSSFVRAERDGVSAEGNARIEEYGFESNRNNSTTYDGRAYKNLAFLKAGKAIFQNSNSEIKGQANYLAFYADTATAPFRKSPNFTNSPADYASTLEKSDNNNYRIEAWSYYDGTNYDLKIVVKATGLAKQTYSFAVDSLSPFTPKATINNAGDATVAFLKDDSTVQRLFVIRRINSADWKDSTNSIPTTFTVSNEVYSDATPASFTLVDQGQTAGSDKTLIWVNWNSDMYTKTFDGTVWDTDAYVGMYAQASNLRVTKNGAKFFLSFFYQPSGQNVKVLTTADFSSYVDTGTRTANSGIDVFTVPNGTGVDVVVQYSSGTVDKFTSVEAVATLSGASLVALTNHSFNSVNPYCFARVLGTSYTLGATSTIDCLVPATSHADPIKSLFKFDIDSLNPSNLHIPHANPNYAPTGGIFTIPGY